MFLKALQFLSTLLWFQICTIREWHIMFRID